MKRTIQNIVSFVSIAILMSSCCTTSHWLGMNSADNHLFIDSKTPGAEVYLNGRYVGHTPYKHNGDKANIKKIKVVNGSISETQKTLRKNKGSIYWNFVPYPMYNWIWGYFLDRSNGTGRKYETNTYYFNF